ncbi:S8 family serine peptidase [uncultured Jatrophihabitans sp.]|uniref:S8 family serine peptidase n=1 Tax=uncultured Jatrophihabitans sp. TaxID=1610747 RepID=UPI0035CC6A17
MGHAVRTAGVLATAAAVCAGAIALSTPAAADSPGKPASAGEPAPAKPTTSARASIATRVLIVHLRGGTRTPLRAALERADRQPGVTVRRRLAGDAFSVEVPAGKARSAAAALASLPGVGAVERPVIRTFVANPTNDPSYPKESAYLAAVAAPAAWARQRGSASVRIAIVDSGVDATHPDLANKISGRYNADAPGQPVTDAVGHGTFVAGVAAAQTDNGVGIAGAGYNTDLLAVKIAAADGSIPIDDEVAGIRWAVDHGAKIVNLSIAGPDASSSERSAIEYAISKGVLVVAAAGNENSTVKQYPAAYPGVVAVGATDTATRRRASFSSRGSWVTLAAPGVGIYSTTPLAGSDFFPARAGYSSASGTSFSAPIVAGEAALLKAQSPGATVAQLRHALTASAHGYRSQGLGAGQVDFARALDHLPPTSTPAAITVRGDADIVRLSASSPAAKVAFEVSGGRRLAPVTVRDGVASVGFRSWGYANGRHAVTAVDCSPGGECGARAATTSLTLANSAPTITSPRAGSRVTGLFTVAAARSGGGAVRVLVDGRSAGFDATAPYRFLIDANSLRDGRHTLQTVLCSPNGSMCAGPRSSVEPVRSAALRFKIRSASRRRFSPNGDGVRDTTTLTYSLRRRAAMVFEVRTPTGLVVRHLRLGKKSAGRHTITWAGRNQRGRVLPDGRYFLGLRAARGNLAGYAQTRVVIDTVAPELKRPNTKTKLFYPARDGYRDRFSAHVTVGAGLLRLVLRDVDGRVVRSIDRRVAAGRRTISWNGRGAYGQVAPGRYTWQFVITDSAGNSRSTARRDVRVSGKRLRTRIVYVTHRGATFRGAGGTARCTSAHRSTSPLAHSLVLVNRCATDDYDLAFADYGFRLPKAIRYSRLKLEVYGSSRRRPSELTSVIDRNDGNIEVPGYLLVRKAGATWHTLQGVRAAGHVTASRRVFLSIYLDSSSRGSNDFAIGRVRLRLTMRVLG